jgi:hypothetical protein
MNRQLKFRVWDFTIKRFDTEIYQAGEQFGHPSSCDWIAQQYTGLTDKNGKEIYEGDLIRGMFDFGPAGLSELMLPVCWHNIDGYQWNYWNLSTIEVVGNAFEHKELLY